MDLDRIKQALAKSNDVMEFSPSEAHRRAKSNFWSYFAAGESLPPTSVDVLLATKYAGDRRVSEWWYLDGFQAWFSNKDEFRQRVEFLADLALDELYLLIKSPNTAAPAKVAAIRMIMDVGQKLAAKGPKEETAENKIGRMSKEELESFIRAGVSKLLPDDSEEDSKENQLTLS
jgi:hypothetical protein